MLRAVFLRSPGQLRRPKRMRMTGNQPSRLRLAYLVGRAPGALRLFRRRRNVGGGDPMTHWVATGLDQTFLRPSTDRFAGTVPTRASRRSTASRWLTSPPRSTRFWVDRTAFTPKPWPGTRESRLFFQVGSFQARFRPGSLRRSFENIDTGFPVGRSRPDGAFRGSPDQNPTEDLIRMATAG